MITRRRLVGNDDRYYDGIHARINNSYYAYGNGFLNQYEAGNARFLSDIIDAGRTGLSITFGYTIDDIGSTNMRVFDDLSQNSIDYWSVTYGRKQRTVTLIGRYMCINIMKSKAGYFFVYDNTNNRYLLKGDFV